MPCKIRPKQLANVIKSFLRNTEVVLPVRMTWPGYCTAACDLGSLLASSPCIARHDTRASPFACFSRVTSRDSHRWRACPRKILEILVGTSNGKDHFGLVLPEYSGPDLKVVHFDQSGHFGRSDRNVPFHLTKLLFPVPPHVGISN